MRRGVLVYTAHVELETESEVTVRIPVTHDPGDGPGGGTWREDGDSVYTVDGDPAPDAFLESGLPEQIEAEAWERGAVFEDDREAGE